MPVIVNKSEYNEETFWNGVTVSKRGIFIAVRSIYIVISLAALIIAVFVMGKVGLSVDEIQAAVRSSAVPMAILLAVFAYSTVKIFTFKRGIRKKFMDSRTRAFESKTLTFNDEGYSCVGEYESRDVPYTYVDRVIETKTAFYIINKSGMDIVAKDGFEQGTADDFKKLISEKCPGAKKNFR